VIAGREFLHRTEDHPVTIRRGPLLPAFEEMHVASVSRELTRAVGYAEYEP
jgi:hypothetical protein